MKNKAPLPLMEQLIMILVFAITAALCLQGFAAANKMSLRQERTSQAVILAQNAAEILKATCGDYEALSEMPDSYHLTVNPIETADPFLSSANIQIFFEDEMLFEITVAWQEVT